MTKKSITAFTVIVFVFSMFAGLMPVTVNAHNGCRFENGERWDGNNCVDDNFDPTDPRNPWNWGNGNNNNNSNSGNSNSGNTNGNGRDSQGFPTNNLYGAEAAAWGCGVNEHWNAFYRMCKPGGAPAVQAPVAQNPTRSTTYVNPLVKLTGHIEENKAQISDVAIHVSYEISQ